MLKKITFLTLIALFVLSLVPVSALANTTSPLLPGMLIKGAGDSVYYYGANEKRYVFPNLNTYKTWFVNFDPIVSISYDLMQSIPLIGIVTYKPGVKLVKFISDPKVYYVDKQGYLRHVMTETIAKELYGNDWNKLVDDMPESFYAEYKFGEPVVTASVVAVPTDYSINEDKSLSTEPDPTINELAKIALTGSVAGKIADLKWTTANLNADMGFKVVAGKEIDPVYPGNDYHYLTDPSARADSWTDLAAGTYYFRVCQYLGGKCGVYSNNLKLTIGTSTSSTTTKKIVLTGTLSGNAMPLSWTVNFTSSQGFKIVKATHSNPVYPGDDYHYLTDPDTRSDVWPDLGVGTYHFRVCEYLGGSCGVYSNDITATVTTGTGETNGSITLTGQDSGTTANLSWSISNIDANLGFKVVISNTTNPVYPGNEYHYLSDSSVRNDSWNELAPGVYHFRVCKYLGGSCGLYSNDLKLTIQ